MQTIFHSSAVTGCTDRREYFTSAMSVNRLSALIAAIWVQLAKKAGLRPEVFKRGAASGKEQAVDQALQVQMLRALIDEPQVALLRATLKPLHVRERPLAKLPKAGAV